MKIYQAISNIMSEITCVKKEKKNQQQGFMFRGIDDVMNVLHPLLAKYHVFVVPEVLEQTREERTTSRGGILLYSILRVKYTFFAEDGSYIETITLGEGMDSADKASNKAMAAALKYAFFQVFCIPTEELIDPDSENPIERANARKITTAQEAEIVAELKRTGVGAKSFFQTYNIRSIADMTIQMYDEAMQKFKQMANIQKSVNVEEKKAEGVI